MNILKFKIWADLGHFGMRFTTSSKATHLIPPRHTIAGILGAILGIPREQVSETFHPKKCKIGIVPATSLNAFRIPLKQLLLKNRSFQAYLKSSVENRSIIPFQMIRDPAYYFFFYHREDSLQKKLKTLLSNHECIYPPSFGMAQLLADFEFTGEYQSSNYVPNESFATASVAPADNVAVFPAEGNKIVIDKMAYWMNPDRSSQRFTRVLFDASGGKIQMELKKDKVLEFIELVKIEETDEAIFLW